MPDQAATPEGAAASAKKGRDAASRRVTRSLRRARTIYEQSDWQDSTEAAFLVQEATVGALMDLAEAVREQQDTGE
jgi:hypothetical protein